jgi:hypothetical protein
MRRLYKQLGRPSVPYVGTKAAIEALSNPQPGWIVFATDTGQFGFYTDSWTRGNLTKDIDSLVLLRADASCFISPRVLSATAAVTTGVLTNGTTDGVDGKFNISVHTDGVVYFKNRTGDGVYLNYHVLSSV